MNPISSLSWPKSLRFASVVSYFWGGGGIYVVFFNFYFIFYLILATDYSFRSVLRQNIGWFDDEKNATGILATKLATGIMKNKISKKKKKNRKKQDAVAVNKNHFLTQKH